MAYSVNEIIFALIRCAVCGEELSSDIASLLTPDLLKQIYLAAKPQDLVHIIAQALLDSEIPLEGEIKNAYEKQKMTAVFRCKNLEHELSAISMALDEAKIRYMPLKGSVIRKYYPNPNLRLSCDVDIYVDERDIEAASSVLREKLNYRLDTRTAHDVAFFSVSGTHVELHYDLIENGEDIRKMLSDPWQGALRFNDGEYGYTMGWELFVAYHIAHMAKHFASGGCGVRPFIDLWILKNKVGYDKSAVFELLKKAGLLKFGETVIRLSDVWLFDGEHTELTRDVERFILDATIYGNTENRVAVLQKRNGGSLRHILGRIFLPYSKLKKIYPRLSDYPILLPFYQIKRWIRLLFFKRGAKAMRELRASATVSEEKLSEISLLWDALELS